MTESEIALSFRVAKDRGEQVKILAQLNACVTQDIVRILLRNGFAPEDIPKRYRREKAYQDGSGKVKREYHREYPEPKKDPETGKTICISCGTLFEGGRTAVFCPVCRKQRQSEKVKECKRREREKRAAERAARDPKQCAVCGAVLENQKATYCKSCAAARKKESMRKSKQRKRGMTL